MLTIIHNIDSKWCVYSSIHCCNGHSLIDVNSSLLHDDPLYVIESHDPNGPIRIRDVL
jgi:hypothetical protein